MATEMSTALRLRRRAGAATLPLLFAALLVSSVLDKVDEKASNAKQVRQAAAHVGTIRPLAIFELVAAFLAVGVIATLVGAVRQRGAGWANGGAVVGALGCVGMALIGAHHLFLYAQLKANPSHAATVFDTLNSSSGPVLILFFAMPVALLLLAISTFRAGIAPLPALVLAVLFFVTDAVPILPGEELIPLAIGLLAFSWIARSLVQVDVQHVRHSATEGESPARLGESTPPTRTGAVATAPDTLH